MKPGLLLTCALAVAPPVLADPGTRTATTQVAPLLIQAIDASNGQAFGVLTGDIADAISRRFGAASPIFIDVSTERRLRQTGCSRLRVTFWQEGVLLPGAHAPRKQTIEFGINYCRDGQPPRAPT